MSICPNHHLVTSHAIWSALEFFRAVQVIEVLWTPQVIISSSGFRSKSVIWGSLQLVPNPVQVIQFWLWPAPAVWALHGSAPDIHWPLTFDKELLNNNWSHERMVAMAFCCQLVGNRKNPRKCLLERNYCRDLDYSCHLWSCFCLPCPATPCLSLPHHTIPCHRLTWGASRHISRPSVEYKIYKYHTISHATLYNTIQRPSANIRSTRHLPFSCLQSEWKISKTHPSPVSLVFGRE